MAQSSVSNYAIGGPINAVSNGFVNHDRGRSPPQSHSRQGGKLLSRRPTDGHSPARGIVSSFFTRRSVAQSATPQEQLGSRYNMSVDRLPRRDPSVGEIQFHGMQRMNSTNTMNGPVPQTRANHEYGQPGIANLPHSSRHGLWNFIAQLPQPADDQTIQIAAQQVFSLADQYVDNFYVNRLHESIRMDVRFRDLDFPHLPGGSAPAVMIQLVEDPTVVIKHCLVHVLLTCIAFDNDGRQLPSLLPPEFTALAKALRGHEIPEQHYSALSAYRVLLSFLRPGVIHDENYQSQLDKSFGKIWDFAGIFRPWLKPKQEDAERDQSFEALLHKTVELGLILFSHPCTFLFNWDLKPATSQDTEIVIAPRLLKINDEAARELERSQLMLNITTFRTPLIQNVEQAIHQQVTANATNGRTSLVEIVENHNHAIPNTQAFHNQVTHSGPVRNSAQFAINVDKTPCYTPDCEISLYDPMAAHSTREPSRQAPGQGLPVMSNIHELDSDPQRRHELDAADSNPQPANSHTSSLLPLLNKQPLMDMSFFLDDSLPEGDEHGRNDAFSRSQTHPHQALRANDSPINADPEGSRLLQANQTSQGNFDHQMGIRRKVPNYPPTASAKQFPSAGSQPVRRRSSHGHRSSSEDRGRSNCVDLAPPSRRASVSSDRTGLKQFENRPVTALGKPKSSGGIPHGILPSPDRMSRRDSRPEYRQNRQPNESGGPLVINLTTLRSNSGRESNFNDNEQRHSPGSRQRMADINFRNERPERKKRDYFRAKLRI